MAIELMARASLNPVAYSIITPRSASRDCDFSFSGIRTAAERIITKLEKESQTNPLPIDVISSVCASCQTAVTRLFCRRVQRAIEYCVLNSFLPPTVRIPAKTWPSPLIPEIVNHSASALVGF